MRVVIYARVSTAKCEKCGVLFELHEKADHPFKGQDPQMQLREATEYCERRGWKNPTVMIDRVSSGKIRPELETLKAFCRRGKVDTVVVYRFDRFARSAKELLEALEEFRVLGINFISLHENIDTTTPVGKLVFTFLAGVAEFEKSLIRERVMSGLATAKANGVRLGRPPRSDEVLERIRVLRRSGHSWRHIAGVTGLPVTTVRRAMLLGHKPASERVQ
jgi:DNA invertase Pin-like site-specific DNA recombinase